MKIWVEKETLVHVAFVVKLNYGLGRDRRTCTRCYTVYLGSSKEMDSF